MEFRFIHDVAEAGETYFTLAQGLMSILLASQRPLRVIHVKGFEVAPPHHGIKFLEYLLGALLSAKIISSSKHMACVFVVVVVVVVVSLCLFRRERPIPKQTPTLDLSSTLAIISRRCSL